MHVYSLEEGVQKKCLLIVLRTVLKIIDRKIIEVEMFQTLENTVYISNFRRLFGHLLLS